MPYTGNLRAQYQKPGSANTLPPPDNAHGENEGDPYPEKWTAPPAAPLGYSDFPPVVMQNPGLTLDRPWLQGHDSQANLMSYPDNATWARDISVHHDADAERGWLATDSTYYPPEIQDNFTSTEQDRPQAYGPTNVPPVVLQRGFNSYEVNNPPREGYDPGGYRYGFWRWAYTWRTRHQNMDRVYDVQPLYDRSITVIENSPAQGDYWGNFADSMARGFTRMNQTPALAREAVDPSEVVESTVDYGTAADSVIGAF